MTHEDYSSPRKDEFYKTKMKYKIGDYVRVKYGCLWLFGIVAHVIEEAGGYDVYYGSRRDWNRFRDGVMLPYSDMMYEHELKYME